MKVIEIIKLIKKNLVILLFTPLILSGLVWYLTRVPVYTYSSETTLYTGIASGSSVEMDKTLSFFATNTAFDNLINVIKSRETQQEVAIRLLAQHLMLPKYDVRYISKGAYNKLQSTTPDYVKALVVHTHGNHPSKQESQEHKPAAPAVIPEQSYQNQTHIVEANETLFSISQMYGLTVAEITEMNQLEGNNLEVGQELLVGQKFDDSPNSTASDTVSLENDSTSAFSFSDLYSSENSITLPPSINREDFEQTVLNLEAYMGSSDTNFIYKLLYFNHPHYSIKAISSVNVQRISSSDLVKLKYDANEPGVCQQTLALLTEVCIKNYKAIKENRSDAVVKYFEFQLKQASGRLKTGEDKLLSFNEDNNIINYYEQSKAVAVVKEDLDVDYNNKRIKLAGTKAAINRIEEKLGVQKQIQLKSSSILEKRNQLSEVNTQIANAEIIGFGKTIDENELVKLKQTSERLKEEIRNSVNELYTYGNSTNGLPINSLLADWIANVIDYEDTKAGIEVLGERIKEFQKQYAIYAPAGANLKRIEREISVSEQEFLEILHGLNLAKLKMQDAELSSSIKAVDPPFFPLSPNATKTKILIIVAGLVGFLLVLTTILAMEYFDDTLKNPVKATKILNLQTIGVFPKIFLKTGSINFPFVTNRLLEMVMQQIDRLTVKKTDSSEPRTLLFMSSLSLEGKTVTAGNIAWKLKKQGKKVLYLNYSRESLRQTETSQIGYPANSTSVSAQDNIRSGGGLQFIGRMLGYGDNRVNPASPFLQKPEIYLDTLEHYIYQVDHNYFAAGNYKDLLEKYSTAYNDKPDYVLIELPPFLYYSYPINLVASADLAILICRANRVWTGSDQGVLDILKSITSHEPVVMLNGVELQVVESVLGDLPKKRSRLRRITKSVLRMQFGSKHNV
ncbi:MAG: LysM peptidoglycan-binding domain-containing protein [Bacteroidales bacterium]